MILLHKVSVCYILLYLLLSFHLNISKYSYLALHYIKSSLFLALYFFGFGLAIIYVLLYEPNGQYDVVRLHKKLQFSVL